MVNHSDSLFVYYAIRFNLTSLGKILNEKSRKHGLKVKRITGEEVKRKTFYPFYLFTI